MLSQTLKGKNGFTLAFQSVACSLEPALSNQQRDSGLGASGDSRWEIDRESEAVSRGRGQSNALWVVVAHTFKSQHLGGAGRFP